MLTLNATNQHLVLAPTQEEWGNMSQAEQIERTEAMHINVFGIGYKRDAAGNPIEVGKGSTAQLTSQHFLALDRERKKGSLNTQVLDGVTATSLDSDAMNSLLADANSAPADPASEIAQLERKLADLKKRLPDFDFGERSGGPSMTEARLHFDGWLELLPFEPRTREVLARRFEAILNASADGDERANAAYRQVVRALDAPARLSEPDEPASQPLIDRVVLVDALLLHFQMMRDRHGVPHHDGARHLQ